MGFLGELVSLIGVLQCSLGVPSSALVIPFFIVFGGSAMSARRKFVLLGGFPVCLVHAISSRQDDFPGLLEEMGQANPAMPAPDKSLAGSCDLGGHRRVRAGFASG
jgi:hypothetical protein